MFTGAGLPLTEERQDFGDRRYPPGTLADGGQVGRLRGKQPDGDELEKPVDNVLEGVFRKSNGRLRE